MHDPEEPTHTNVHPDSQTAREAGLVSYANATFTDLLSWLPTRPTRDTLPSRTTDTQDVLLHDNTKPASPKERRLLIIDGYSSHITADFIAFYIDNAIDILILPLHCSYAL
ncbi:MAG: hypothetical protein FE78DRAFT_29737 [Acidomyces sp. 'richmondensis']|nr:MAG: hypothetical protein FE78DRAFT_29737 [Acidomyces sp. 'richmondensis']